MGLMKRSTPEEKEAQRQAKEAQREEWAAQYEAAQARNSESQAAAPPRQDPQTDDGEELAASLAGSEAEEAEAVEGLSAEIRGIADKKLRHKFGVKRELKALPEILGENEPVLNMAAGQYDGKQGLLIVTDRRLVFFEKGMVRSRQEDFPYSKISSLQTQTKMTTGVITIFVSGNKALIKSVLPKERVNEIGEYVRARIAAGDRPTAHATPAPPAPPTGAEQSHSDRLQSLQALKDQGLITDEEYATRREKILDSL